MSVAYSTFKTQRQWSVCNKKMVLTYCCRRSVKNQQIENDDMTEAMVTSEQCSHEPFSAYVCMCSVLKEARKKRKTRVTLENVFISLIIPANFYFNRIKCTNSNAGNPYIHIHIAHSTQST